VTAESARPTGHARAVSFVLVMSVITLGIYTLFWMYKSFAEIRRYRQQGVGGLVGLLLALVIVSIFLLPAYVGRMYKEDGWDDRPISGWAGWWHLLPYVGVLIWMAKIQGNLNRFWEQTSSSGFAVTPRVR
jgi:uncharacterized protein DUF4234